MHCTDHSRVLLVYYSQSGDAARIADALGKSLHAPIELVSERLRPKLAYPFPWRSVGRFFDVLPECHLGPLPELAPPQFDPDQHFDLVILVYQVWFLAPSLPVQSFLRSSSARVLRNTKVVTISVSRNMWHSASETMKGLLQQCGARHIDNAAVTHQGPAWATFITTPRALLFGKTAPFWGVFPPAGIGEKELARVTRLGEAIRRQLDELRGPDNHPLLRGLEAVPVNSRYLIADLFGWYWFRAWAYFLKLLGRLGPVPRRAGIYCFVVCLVFAIVVAIPLSMVARLLLWPFMSRWTAAYVRRLEEPTGGR
jgi:hypothetical protein